jgi:transcriptional regulator
MIGATFSLNVILSAAGASAAASRIEMGSFIRPSGLTRVDDLGTIVDVLGFTVKRISNANMPKPSDLLQGTLDLLILKTLVRESMHGWGISKRILQLSGEVLSVQQGSLYPALHRLEQQGWIAAEWKDTDLGRSAKFYALTPDGKRQLERELESWNRLSSAVGLLLKKA